MPEPACRHPLPEISPPLQSQNRSTISRESPSATRSRRAEFRTKTYSAGRLFWD